MSRTGKELSLVLTSNSTVMISFRPRGGRLWVRLHKGFVEAPDSVIDEIVCFVRSGKGKTPLLREFVRNNESLFERRARECALRTSGRCHDLAELFDLVNREYFRQSVTAAVTWGRRGRMPARRRTLGSYDPAAHLIRINPVLDRKGVPGFFVRFILYHEMLHAVLGVKRTKQRKSVHTKEFRDRERAFRDYEKAVEWERSPYRGF